MVEEKRPLVVTGNWKMYKTIDQAQAFIQALISRIPESSVQIYLAVPFTAILGRPDLTLIPLCPSVKFLPSMARLPKIRIDVRWWSIP